VGIIRPRRLLEENAHRPAEIVEERRAGLADLLPASGRAEAFDEHDRNAVLERYENTHPGRELGSRNVTNSKRPLKAIEDFKGLKIRMQPNETHLATFRAIGANPVPLDIKELYSALQQGVVDGQENPYSIINANRYSEVQKYLSDTGHFFDFIILMVNKRAFDALPADQKNVVADAAKTAVAEQRKMAAESDAAALIDLKSKGMQFDAISPETRAQLRKASAGVIEDVKKRVGGDLVDQMNAAARKQ